MAIASVLFVAIGSTLLLAGKAVPGSGTARDALAASSRVVHQMADELRGAIHVTKRTATEISFTVADRDGDGRPETIAYTWSGVIGEPLMRRLNNNTATPLLTNITQFNLFYEHRPFTELYPGPPIESAEQELSSYTSTSSTSETPIKHDLWYGQRLNPVLPNNTVWWRVTRVKIHAQRQGTVANSTTAMISPLLPNGLPSDTVIDQTDVPEASLPTSYAWFDINFANAGYLYPEDTIGLLLTSTDINGTMNLEYRSGGVSSSSAGLFLGDPTWRTSHNDKAMRHYVYGTISAPTGPQQMITRRFVTSISISLQTGDSAAGQVQSAVHMLNGPEALASVWEADFNADPTLLDLNADAAMDWSATGGFNAASLAGGVWTADRTIQTGGSQNFDLITSLDVKMRDTTADGTDGPGVRMHVDRSGDTYGVVYATTSLQADNTQTLSVFTEPTATTTRRLLRLPGLPRDHVHLRLMTDPVRDTVNVRVNDGDYGTFSVPRYTKAATARAIQLYRAGAGAEFAHARVRLGGAVNSLPNAVAAADRLVIDHGQTINFSGAGSSDFENDPLSLFWTFGDGGSATGVNASHQFNYKGYFTVVLTVTDDKGGSSTSKLIVRVR